MAATEKKANTIYLFKVSLAVDSINLKSDEEEIWRVIALRGTNTLVDFHKAIFKAFNREDEHLWSFFFGKPYKPKTRTFVSDFEFQLQVEEYEARNYERASMMKVQDLPLPKNKKFTYEFDYGDEWWHEIKFIGVEEAEPKCRYPKVVEKHGDSPPQYPDWEEDDEEEDDEDWDEDDEEPLTEEQDAEVCEQLFKHLFDEEDFFEKEVSYDAAGREVITRKPDLTKAINQLMEKNQEYFKVDPNSDLSLSALTEALMPFNKAVSALEAVGCLRGLVNGKHHVEDRKLALLLIHQRKNISESDLEKLIETLKRFKARFADEFNTGAYRSLYLELNFDTNDDFDFWVTGIADKIDGFYSGLELSRCELGILDEAGQNAMKKLAVVEGFLEQIQEDLPDLDLDWLLTFAPMIHLLDLLAQTSIFEVSRAFHREYARISQAPKMADMFE